MQQRMNYYPKFEPAFEKMFELTEVISKCSLGGSLIHLIDMRVSQINGCLFCIDMHVKEAKICGEKELRLHHLAAWKESSLFSEREKAAFLWAETLTLINQRDVTDEIYAKVKEYFSDEEIVELTMVVATINSWNRLGIAFQATPGTLDKQFGLDKAGL